MLSNSPAAEILSLSSFLGDYVPSAFFANLSFLLLFVAMGSFWLDLAFTTPSSNSVATSQGDQSAGLSLLSFPNFKELLLKLSGNFAILGANLSIVFLLCIRWLESGHFPLSNLYESLMFLAWSCTSIYLWYLFSFDSFIEFPKAESLSSKNSLFSFVAKSEDSAIPALNKLLGAILAPCALFLNAFATFSLPTEMQQAGPLVPALQSNWLMMHVTVMIVSYAALMLGSLLSIAYLILGFTNTLQTPTDLTEAESSLMRISKKMDYLSYRIIGIGFPFLTIGILSGAVWANEAWGSYWSWDPKETWALLTWLVFAIYLHTRFTKGWEGRKPAVLASLGFIVVWICYLGVNLIGEGLHSYGFLA